MRFVIRWGLVLACVALAVLWLHTGFTWDERSPFVNDWLIILVFVLMAMPFVFQNTATPTEREFRGARLGGGTVVEARRTGTTVNDQPELDIVMDVETADGETFRGTARHVVDITTLAELVPGAFLAVRYQPGRRDGKVMIDPDATTDELQDVTHAASFARGELDAKGYAIYRDGVRTTALVRELRPTGEIEDGAAVVDLLLTVTRPDGSTYDARVRKGVPPSGIPGIQPGHIIEVRYLPEDEHDVSIGVQVR